VLSLKILEVEQKQVPKYAVFMAFAFLFTYYTRLQDNIPGLNAVPWVGVLSLTFALWGITQILTVKGRFFSTPVALIFWLGVLFGISGIGAVSTVAYQLSLEWIFELFPQCVALVIIFSALKQIRALHNLWCLIYLVVALFTIKNAPSGPGDFLRDANDVSLGLGMGIPFVYYALFQPNFTTKRRLFYLAVLLLIFICIILASSRGGFLGVVAGLLAIWWMSRNRIKIMMFGIIGIFVAGSVLISVIPENYVDDMQSINDKSDNTRNERFRSWEIGWEMFKANPFLGVGAGNFPNTVHLYQHKTSWWTGNEKSLSGRVSHSLYFQILPELGLVGILIFGYIIFYLPLKLLKLCKRLDMTEPCQLQIKLLCQALIASMAVYAIAGAFISVAYYPHIPIWLFMYTVVVRVAADKVG